MSEPPYSLEEYGDGADPEPPPKALSGRPKGFMDGFVDGPMVPSAMEDEEFDFDIGAGPPAESRPEPQPGHAEGISQREGTLESPRNPPAAAEGMPGIDDAAKPAPRAAPPAKADPPSPADLVRFGPSPRALSQRRILAAALAVMILVCLWVTLGGTMGVSGWDWIRWVLAAALVLGLWLVVRAAGSNPLGGREVLLHPQALELRRGNFRRLVVFANIRHLRIVQSPGGRLWSLRLDLEDDSVTLRDVDGLPRIFAAAAQNRPAGVLIEVEEARVDWGEPRPWILLAFGLAFLAAAAAALT
jgi:hypothetical protein